ncbi:uncharacterized protein LOC127841335 isoform X2 [Dreissena polymorpha]|nr:uncharacterized protein LOC127841335 isoform X2 [Dreissena polymorpha]
MGKPICISSDEEDDIWEYNSQKRSSICSSSVGSKRPVTSRRKPLPQKHIKQEEGVQRDIKSEKNKQKTKRKKIAKEPTPAIKEEQTPNSKRQCPVCQMPFTLLSKIETPSWHIDQCLMEPNAAHPECTDGKDCQSTIASHYQRFRHTQLARSRRKSVEVTTQKGDIGSAKVKLQFDEPPSTMTGKTKIHVPGSSSACSQTLDSVSPVSNAHRSDKDVCDLDTDDSLPAMDLASGRLLHRGSTQLIADIKPVVPSSSDSESSLDLIRGRKVRKLSSESNKSVIQLSSESEMDVLKDNEKRERRNSSEHSEVRKLFRGASDGDTCCSDELDCKREILTAVKITNLSNITQHKGDTHKEESQVITRVNASDLILCTSNNTDQSIEDIFDVHDEDRTVSQMLQDVDGEERSEDTGEIDNELMDAKNRNQAKESVSKVLMKLSKEEDGGSEGKNSKIVKLFRTSAHSIDLAGKKMTINDSTSRVQKNCTKGYASEKNILVNDQSEPNRRRDKSKQINESLAKSKVPLNFDESTTDSGIGFFAKKRRLLESGNTDDACVTRNITTLKSANEDKDTDRESPTGCQTERHISETHMSSEADDESSLIECMLKGQSNLNNKIKVFKTESGKGPKRRNTSKMPDETSKSKKLKGLAGGQRSLTSFFKSVKSEDIVIRTDSSSSDDFAKMTSDGKCCLNCTAYESECAKKSVSAGVNDDSKGVNKSCETMEMFSPKVSDANVKQVNISLSNSRGNSHCQETLSKRSVSVNHGICTNTPEFLIQEICTVSQNTFSKIGSIGLPEIPTDQGGGFCSENDEGSFEEDVTGCSASPGDSVKNKRAVIDRVSTDGGLMNYVAVKVNQIRKNAADILMASSRFVYHNMSGVSTAPAKQQEWGRSIDSVTSEGTSLSGNSSSRQCPFYKKIPGTSFTVDAFRYGLIPDCTAYFLSHFHYDHYMGLNKKFMGNIYCSQITANLVCKQLGVDRKCVHPLQLNTTSEIDGVSVTLLEANHCPGAVLILFRLKTGKVHLHTGDFRASRSMECYTELCNVKVNALFLDTTYCDPQYVFPPQEEVIQFAVKLAKEARAKNRNTLIVCGSYTIGKERIFSAISEALDCKICVTKEKLGVLMCLEDPLLLRRCVVGWHHSGLHVVPMNKLNHKVAVLHLQWFVSCAYIGRCPTPIEGLKEHMQLSGKGYTSVLALEPTGWTQARNKTLSDLTPKLDRDGITLYGVPYSEHSSFLEMKRFVQFIQPERILPTVNNGNVHSRRKMEV